MKILREFHKSIKNNKKYQRILFCIEMFLILSVFIIMSKKVADDKAKVFTVVEDNEIIKFIDNVVMDEKSITIDGWCYYIGADSLKSKIQVFLIDSQNENNIVWLKNTNILREDVNAYYDSNIDYSHVGFKSTVKRKKLNLENTTYKIMIKLTYNIDEKRVTDTVQRTYVKTIETGAYISKNGLIMCRANDFVEPQLTESDLLNNVLTKGRVCFYRADKGIYVYQYQDKLYWIANASFAFLNDGHTYIQYQMKTTREDKLPSERIENGWNWDNRGFDFETNELVDENTSPYRVSVCDIPKEYPVTYIWTGYHNGVDWEWMEKINININALK